MSTSVKKVKSILNTMKNEWINKRADLVTKRYRNHATTVLMVNNSLHPGRKFMRKQGWESINSFYESIINTDEFELTGFEFVPLWSDEGNVFMTGKWFFGNGGSFRYFTQWWWKDLITEEWLITYEQQYFHDSVADMPRPFRP